MFIFAGLVSAASARTRCRQPKALIAAAFVLALGGCGSQTGGSKGAPTPPPPAVYPPMVQGGGYDDYTPYSDAQDAWDNQDGPDWAVFNDAYVAGWDEGCDVAFADSPDGSLYDQGEEFTATDCSLNNPGDAVDASDIPVYVPDDPEAEGDELGQHDGCISAFEDLPSDAGGALYYGQDSYDESLCP